MSEVMKAWEIIGNEYRTDWRNIRNLCDNVYFGRNGKFPGVSSSLTNDQQVVLEWLKEVYTDNDEGYFSVISYLTNPTTEEEVHDPAHIALACLHPDEEAQVLAAFAEWGLKEANQ